MGIGFVLILYAAALCIAAAVGSGVLAAATFLLTKRARAGRKRVLIASAAFPFLCVAFAGAWFMAYATINEVVFHRDPGLGDTWETPLPNGYALLMIDVTDEGTIYNPKTQGGYGSVFSRADTEFGVRRLQVSGKRIFGARDSGYLGRIGQNSNFFDTYFELDTDGGAPTEFKTVDELRRHAASEGVSLKLREFQSVFSDYRTTWFDYLAGLVVLIVPAAGFLLLGTWVWRIRSTGYISSSDGEFIVP